MFPHCNSRVNEGNEIYVLNLGSRVCEHRVLGMKSKSYDDRQLRFILKRSWLVGLGTQKST